MNENNLLRDYIIKVTTWPGTKEQDEQTQTTNSWPVESEEIINSIFNFSWMAWTWQTALFFLFILISLIFMTIWEIRSPGGHPRKGIIGLNTTRGDRLFISLLGSAFIHFLWLFFFSNFLWIATILSILYFLIVFRYF